MLYICSSEEKQTRIRSTKSEMAVSEKVVGESIWGGDVTGADTCRKWVSHGDTRGKDVPGKGNKYNHKKTNRKENIGAFLFEAINQVVDVATTDNKTGEKK